MSYQTQEVVEYVETQCGECGVRFAMEKFFRDKRIESGQTFYCPNGHGRVFSESTQSKLEKAQAQLALERDQKAATERELLKLKERVANGVCPCCKRNFKNLQRHIATKHKKFAHAQ